MSELPSGWTASLLGELCNRIVDGSHNPPKASEAGQPMLSARNIQGRRILFDDFRWISGREFDVEHARTQVSSGDVLLTIVGTIGRTAVVSNESPRFALQRSVAVLKAQGATEPRYLAYVLESPAVQRYLQENAKGTAQKGIYLGALGLVEVPVAPLPEQKRIADKLDALLARVDACKERLDRVPGILKRFRQSVLAAATSGELTREWREERGLEEGAGLPHPPVHEEHGEWSSQFLPTGWRWLAFDELFDDATDSRRKLKQSDYEVTGPFAVVDQGEAIVGGYTSLRDLLSVAGTPVIVFGDHTRCVKWIDFPFVQGADGVKVLVVRTTSAVPQFAHLTMQACRLPNKGYSRHMRFLRATFFPIPTREEQAEIVRRTSHLLDAADALEQRLATLHRHTDRLTPATLAKAFRGELVPQDPSDEPASVMLARLKGAEPVRAKKRNGKGAKA